MVYTPSSARATDGPAGAPGRRGNGYYRWDVAQQPVPKNPGKTNGPHSLINCLTLSADFSSRRAHFAAATAARSALLLSLLLLYGRAARARLPRGRQHNTRV